MNKEQIKNRPLTEEERKAAELEIEAINSAEVEKSLFQAVDLLAKAISIAPEYPSPYNNRAQVYRLEGDLVRALEDLERAIYLSDDFPLVKRQALCQRAWIKYADGDNEAAFIDFEMAGKLGCDDARKMAVRCNPYAKLCNSIVQGMLEHLYYSSPQ